MQSVLLIDQGRTWVDQCRKTVLGVDEYQARLSRKGTVQRDKTESAIFLWLRGVSDARWANFQVQEMEALLLCRKTQKNLRCPTPLSLKHRNIPRNEVPKQQGKVHQNHPQLKLHPNPTRTYPHQKLLQIPPHYPQFQAIILSLLKERHHQGPVRYAPQTKIQTGRGRVKVWLGM